MSKSKVEEDNSITNFMVKNDETNEIISYNESEKTANITIGDWNLIGSMPYNSYINNYISYWEYDEINIFQKIWFTFLIPTYTGLIKTEQLDDKDCYVVYQKSGFPEFETYQKAYINKQTFLVERVDDIINNQTITYEWSFEGITEEDVKVPDLTDYYVKIQ